MLNDEPPLLTAFCDNARPFYVSDSNDNVKRQPIIIDNGSYELRAGFLNDELPRFRCRTVVSKSRTKSNPQDKVGEYLTPEDWIRAKFRSPFESNVVCNFSGMESILDYTFSSLRISESCVDHPIVATETLCNPTFSRSCMNELLFECYGVPSVCYGIDDLFSLAYNNTTQKLHSQNGIVVGFGFEASHVIPVVANTAMLSQACRVSIGGFHLVDNLLRSLAIHFPQHKSSLWPMRVEEIIKRFCYTSLDYPVDVEAYGQRKKPAIAIQLPFEINRPKQLTEAQIEEKLKRQKLLGSKLKLLADERRLEKLNFQKGLIQGYEELLSERDSGVLSSTQFTTQLKRGGFDDEQDFFRTLKDLKKKVDAQERKRSGVAETVVSPKSDSVRYPLLEVPDEKLTEIERKEKRKQRLLKSGADARERKRADKEVEAARMVEAKRVEREQFQSDPDKFVLDLEQQRMMIQQQREKRLKQKYELSDRRSAAAKKRMRVIAKMGTGTMEGSSFGKNDSDWDVYRKVAKTGDRDDSESEDEHAEINRLTALLQEYAPERYAATEDVPYSGSQSEYHQIYFSTHRVQQPEILFQPSIIGIEQAGIAETISAVLSRFQEEQQLQMTSNVLITGGSAWLPHLQARLSQDLTRLRPWRSPLQVSRALNPSLDAWRGARMFAASSQLHSASVTRAEYEECGSSYLKEHRLGNVYVERPQSHARIR